MGEFSVRPARPGDLSAIRQLFAELNYLQRGWRVFPPRESLVEQMEERYRWAIEGSDPGSCLVVACEGEEVVGMALGRSEHPSTMSDEAALELSSVVVHPSHRGRGIAKALVSDVASFARRRGLRMIVLKTFVQNEAALRAWERLGFQPRILQMVAPADAFGRSQPSPPRAEAKPLGSDRQDA